MSEKKQESLVHRTFKDTSTSKPSSVKQAFFGCSKPCMHLSQHGKDKNGNPNGKPPVASLRHCMKENKFSIFGKNLDEITKLKGKTKAGTGRSSDKWTAITDAIEKGDVTSMKEFARWTLKWQPCVKIIGGP